MLHLYQILIVLFVTISATSGRSRVNTRTAKRLINAEHRLDTITADISVFRLDLNDIWNTMDLFNETVYNTKSDLLECSNTVEKEPKETNERIYSAFQQEKKFTRDFVADMSKQFLNFERETNSRLGEMTEKEKQTRTELDGNLELVHQKLDNFIHEVNKGYMTLFTTTMQELGNLTSTFSKRTESLEIDLGKCQKLEEENRKCQSIISDKHNEIQEMKAKLQEIKSTNIQLHRNIQELEKRCPFGWYEEKRSCYFVSSYKATWDNGMSWCKRNGGYLVEYSDRGELKFVFDLVKMLSKWDSSVWTGFWTGADDTRSEGQWKWSTSGISFTFENWKARQPDNGSGTEDCMVTLVNLNGQWNDEQCYVKYKFVCERML